MKRYCFILTLMTVSISCKEKDVSLANQLAGVYDYYDNRYGSIPNPDANGKQPFGHGGVTVENIGKDLIKLRINNQGRNIWDFLDCQVIDIEDKSKSFPYYARIIDRNTNIEIAKVRDHYDQTATLRIDFNFTDSKNDKLVLYAIKRKE